MQYRAGADFPVSEHTHRFPFFVSLQAYSLHLERFPLEPLDLIGALSSTLSSPHMSQSNPNSPSWTVSGVHLRIRAGTEAAESLESCLASSRMSYLTHCLIPARARLATATFAATVFDVAAALRACAVAFDAVPLKGTTTFGGAVTTGLVATLAGF